jgi:hypothetical protein
LNWKGTWFTFYLINLHAIPGCQVSVYYFHASKILHSLGNLNAHIYQLFTDHLHLKHTYSNDVVMYACGLMGSAHAPA